MKSLTIAGQTGQLTIRWRCDSSAVLVEVTPVLTMDAAAIEEAVSALVDLHCAAPAPP